MFTVYHYYILYIIVAGIISYLDIKHHININNINVWNVSLSICCYLLLRSSVCTIDCVRVLSVVWWYNGGQNDGIVQHFVRHYTDVTCHGSFSCLWMITWLDNDWTTHTWTCQRAAHHMEPSRSLFNQKWCCKSGLQESISDEMMGLICYMTPHPADPI